MAEWDVLIKDHHAAYITWDEFERNLAVIANNATGMSCSARVSHVPSTALAASAQSTSDQQSGRVIGPGP
jgi:hypothetical protein